MCKRSSKESTYGMLVSIRTIGHNITEQHSHTDSEKAQRAANDGSVHSFTIKELASQGWDLRLKPGTEEYTLTAPIKPGEYLVQCMVPCGPGHAEQRMKLVVAP